MSINEENYTTLQRISSKDLEIYRESTPSDVKFGVAMISIPIL